ncbi:Flp family type IVb pilin [Nocardioides jishulii]|uniref:Flp family type IVb pilin n=1 Tax=Nocardioides jishulii TaxID=2575440 RepID=A0A4U2YP71_9ACTN|nr:Flp family type IVb pilin [Nocardioides jishulii]QCX27137.1 Flp family type IVb pilin [Nocardioides jishulii]TKI61621.1 Flp family type IVb pilin [Nocardioides jishulii]
MQFLTHVRHLLAGRASERGASAVEYGLLVAGIAGMIVAIVFLFGGFMNELMGDSCGTITTWVTKNAEC